MKHLFNALPKLAALAAVALSISSCNRAEYAMLPKTTPYHATYGSIKSAPASVQKSEEAVVVEAPAAQPEEKNVAVESVAATAPVVAASAAATPAVAAVAAPAAPAKRASLKSTLTQRLALNKVSKQLDKLTSKVQIKQHSDTAKTNALSGNLRTGIILLLIGLLVSLFSGINGIFGLIGGIIAIIGVIFIILWLLDEL